MGTATKCTKNIAMLMVESNFWYGKKRMVGKSNKLVDGIFSKLKTATNSVCDFHFSLKS